MPQLQPRSLLFSVALSAALLTAMPIAGNAQSAPQENPQTSTAPENPTTPTTGSEPPANQDTPVPVVVEKVDVVGYIPAYAERATALGMKTDAPILDIPQSVTVFGGRLFSEQRPQSLDDIVRNASGVVTVSRFGGRQDHIAIRGFEMGTNRNGVLRNGVQSVSRVQAEVMNLERVELLKGPSSILYGRLEVGGIINSVTRKPQASRGLQVFAQGGSFDQLQGGFDASGHLMGSLDSRLYVSSRRNDSFRDGLHGDRQVVNPSLRWTFSPATTLVVEYEYIGDTRTMDRGFTTYMPSGNQNTGRREGYIIDLPRGRFLGDPERDRSIFRTDTAWVTFEHRTPRWALTNITSYGRGTENRFNNEPSAITSAATLASGLMSRTVVSGDTVQSLAVNDTWATMNYSWGRMPAAVSVGATVRRDLEAEARDSLLTTPINIYTGAVVPVGPGQTRYQFLQKASDYQSIARTNAVYVSQRVDLSRELKVFGSLRYESIDQTSDSRALRDAAGLVVGPASTVKYNFDPVAPSVAMIYQPTTHWSVYTNYTRSYSQQNDSFLAGTAQALERGSQREVGVKGDLLGGRVGTTLALYQIEKENMTIREADTFVPVGRARSRGLEFDVSGTLPGGVAVVSSYAYTDAVTVQGGATPANGAASGAGGSVSGRWLPGIPRHTLSVWGAYTRTGRFGGLTLGAGVFHTGDRGGNAAEQFIVPASTRADLSATWQKRRTALTCAVRNLTDAFYYLGARASSNVEPAPPRSVTIDISQRF